MLQLATQAMRYLGKICPAHNDRLFIFCTYRQTDRQNLHTHTYLLWLIKKLNAWQ